MKNLKYSQGMTLIEILIVVAIVALLAAVVYPAYLEHLAKTRRADAKISLAELAQLEEDFYANNNNTYTTSFSSLLGLSGSQTEKHGFEVQSGNFFSNNLLSKDKHYVISFPKDSGKNSNLSKRFTLRAEADANGEQAGDADCKAFEINATSAKTAWDAAGNESQACW